MCLTETSQKPYNCEVGTISHPRTSPVTSGLALLPWLLFSPPPEVSKHSLATSLAFHPVAHPMLGLMRPLLPVSPRILMTQQLSRVAWPGSDVGRGMAEALALLKKQVLFLQQSRWYLCKKRAVTVWVQSFSESAMSPNLPVLLFLCFW